MTDALPRHPAPADPRSLDDLYAIVEAKFEHFWKEDGHRFRERAPEQKEALDKLDRVREAFTAKQKTGRDPSCEGMYGMMLYDVRDVVAMYWAKVGGAFAIEAFAGCFTVDWWGHYLRSYIDDQETHPKYPIAYEDPTAMVSLRRALAQLDEREYAAAKAKADELASDAPIHVRASFAFLFPESGGAKKLLAELTAPHVDWHIGRGALPAMLVAAAPDGESALAAATLFAKAKDERALVMLVPTMAKELGDAAGPALAKLLSAVKAKDHRTELVRLLTGIKTPEAMRSLAELVDDKNKDIRKLVAAHIEANMALARPILEDLVSRRAKVADTCRTLLGAQSPATAPAAEVASDLPPIFASPPWTRGKRTKLPEKKGLVPKPRPDRIVWPPNERETALSLAADQSESLRRWKNVSDAPARTPGLDQSIAAHVASRIMGADWQRRLYFIGAIMHLATDDVALKIWTETPIETLDPSTYDFYYALARFEERAIPRTVELLVASPQRAIDLLLVLDSPRVALLAAEANARMKRLAPIARKWLAAYPETAASVLVPVALSGGTKEREWAQRAVRMLPEAVVMKIAAEHGVEKEIATIRGFDPLDDFPAKLPNIPDWAREVPAPLTKDGGRALPAEPVVTMLAFARIDDPYAGLELVREVCTPESLAELAWALFQQWMLAGAEGKEDWAMMALAHFGSDEIARRLTPKIREWPGESAHARAVKGLDVLAMIGTDLALMYLDRIAEKVKFKGLQEKARAKIEEVAEARGLTRDELADRIAPTLDLEADGSRTLSFGARSFVVGFDEHLAPHVFNASQDQKRLADLPKPGKADDAAIAKESIASWKALKKDAKAVAESQILRLERAMCTRRRWTAQEAKDLLVAHPLVGHLVRRLVWSVYDDGIPILMFRVAEDRSLADIEDKTIELPPDARVGIVHPLEAKLDAWATRFAEYEIIQPFGQLERETYAIEKSEASAAEIARFAGVKVKTGRVLSLEGRGWRRGIPQDAGWIWQMHKPLGNERVAELELGGGILASAMAESPAEQELGALRLVDARGEVRAGVLDPIVFSELVRDVEMLRA